MSRSCSVKSLCAVFSTIYRPQAKLSSTDPARVRSPLSTAAAQACGTKLLTDTSQDAETKGKSLFE